MAWEMDEAVIGDRIDAGDAIDLAYRLSVNPFRFMPDRLDEVRDLYAERLTGWPRIVAISAIERLIDEERDWPPWAVVREALLAEWPQKELGTTPQKRVLTLVRGTGAEKDGAE